MASCAALVAACASLGQGAITPHDGRFTESTAADGAVRAAYEDASAFLGPGRVALISFVRGELFLGKERLMATTVCVTDDPDDCSSARWFVNGREVRARDHSSFFGDEPSDTVCLHPLEARFELAAWDDLQSVEVLVCGVRIAFDRDQVERIRRVAAAAPRVDRPESHIFDGFPAEKGTTYPVRPRP